MPDELTLIDCGPHRTANPKFKDGTFTAGDAPCLCDPGYSRYHANCIPETSVAVFEEKSVKECGPNAYWDEVEGHNGCDFSNGVLERVYTKEITVGCFCLPRACRNSSGCYDLGQLGLPHEQNLGS